MLYFMRVWTLSVLLKQGVAAALAKSHRRALVTGAGLGDWHGREWLERERGKMKACMEAHEESLQYARVGSPSPAPVLRRDAVLI